MSLQRLTRPDFIVIGAMKCATSTLHEQLARQPGIFMSSPKEPCFFSDDESWARGLEWYESLFNASESGDLCGESSTHYTKLPTYPETVVRMRGTLPDHTRFIYVMRHPIDRLVSQYVHEWTERHVDASINEAVDQLPQLVEYSRYAAQIEPYISAFGAERILPVFFERLIRNPQEQLERIARFIGYTEPVHWQNDSERENVSSERIRKSPIRSFVATVPGLRPLLHAVLSDSSRDRMKSRWRMSGRPSLSAEVRTRLETVFDNDLARLTHWLSLHAIDVSSLPLSCANFTAVAERAVPRNSIEREAV